MSSKRKSPPTKLEGGCQPTTTTTNIAQTTLIATLSNSNQIISTKLSPNHNDLLAKQHSEKLDFLANDNNIDAGTDNTDTTTTTKSTIVHSNSTIIDSNDHNNNDDDGNDNYDSIDATNQSDVDELNGNCTAARLSSTGLNTISNNGHTRNNSNSNDDREYNNNNNCTSKLDNCNAKVTGEQKLQQNCEKINAKQLIAERNNNSGYEAPCKRTKIDLSSCSPIYSVCICIVITILSDFLVGNL